ncbi:galectin-4-like isoform X3 [Ctenocephalides felis]|uniref:galectin-4-like isoform X3 n=1 Tax=Ctenocephalides felis TaxID=7515 RepID=UPI000E6E4195|nr:galectin-4-like isoform X3 [Ctenocephalides felis]
MRPETKYLGISNPEMARSLCDVCRPCFESICGEQNDEDRGLLISEEVEDVSQIPQFVSKFYTPLKTGSIIEVRGYLPEDSERFAINLCSGEAGEDIAFHFNPRLSQNYVARNSRRTGEWGQEESASALPFTIRRGAEFVITIFVAKDDYLVAVNGEHFCGFAFRAPLKITKLVRVTGDVRDIRVQQRSSDYYPEVLPDILDVQSQCENENELQTSNKENLPVPYLASIPTEFLAGKQLQIRGRLKILPHSFFINIQSTAYIYPHPQILLHINPRFGEVGGVHTIIRNSWLNGSWGVEERSPVKNFCPGKYFEMGIKADLGFYTITVNGIIVAEFRSRVSCTLAKYLYIQGDVEIYSVCLNKPVVPYSNTSMSEIPDDDD